MNEVEQAHLEREAELARVGDNECCSFCDGVGTADNGWRCPECGGTGLLSKEEEIDRRYWKGFSDEDR